MSDKVTPAIASFLSKYDEDVFNKAMEIRKVLFNCLPGIIEQVDVPAKMIAYCYGQKYQDMICTILPFKKGIKLGFYKGAELADPNRLLKGTGKISRFIEIESEKQIQSVDLKKLLLNALTAYNLRSKA